MTVQKLTRSSRHLERHHGKNLCFKCWANFTEMAILMNACGVVQFANDLRNDHYIKSAKNKTVCPVRSQPTHEDTFKYFYRQINGESGTDIDPCQSRSSSHETVAVLS